MYLPQKTIRGRQIAVTFHEHQPNNEHRIIRSDYPRDSLRQLPLPATSTDEVAAALSTGGVLDKIGEDIISRVDELYAVVSVSHVRHV